MKKHVGVGFRVGKLTVESSTEKRRNKYIVWKCRCDCGGEILLDTRCLQRGTVRDCGCSTIVNPGQRDITGMRFGKLVAVAPVNPPQKGGTVWHCRCDCGGEIDAPLRQLTSGYRKSCGCMSHPPLKNLVGKRFGLLTVLAYDGKRDRMHRWRCLCDCGKEVVVGQTLLQSGKTKSCGCLQTSIIVENLKLCDGTSVAIIEASRHHLLSTNTSGFTGVYRNRHTGKWCAQITFKGKTYFLGSYSKIEDAAQARKEAEDRLFGEFLEWYYSTHGKPEESEKLT
jgi:hypothetical protein